MPDSKKSIEWGYLPDEILTRIFTFLPIKSIITCTLLSKTWKSLIKNPTFISTHLRHSRNKNQNLFLLSVSQNEKQVYTLHNEDDPDFTEYTSFDSPFHTSHLQHPNHRTYIARCTFNGLICLSYGLPNRAEEVFLWNPCVRKFLQLPYPDVTVNTHGASCTSFGFGFDPKTNDYKVVRILSILGSPLYPEKSQPVVNVYSLSTGEWRVLSASASLPPIYAVTSSWPPVFANGALHWIAVTSGKQFVLVFDLGDEVFSQILLPELREKMTWTRLSVYGNSIAGFCIKLGTNSTQINIWVMKEYGVESPWTPFFTADYPFGEDIPRPIGSADYPFGEDIPRPIGFRRNGDAVFGSGEGKLVSWNPESKEFKYLRMNRDHNPYIDSYIESLVLLDKAAKVAGPRAIMVGDELQMSNRH